MAEYLVGKDPLNIEDRWQAMYRSSYSRSMPVLVDALSGIEMAMCLAKWLGCRSGNCWVGKFAIAFGCTQGRAGPSQKNARRPLRIVAGGDVRKTNFVPAVRCPISMPGKRWASTLGLFQKV